MGFADRLTRAVAGAPSSPVVEEKAASLDALVPAWLRNGSEAGIAAPSWVDLESATGLPAWLSVISRLANGAVMTPPTVFRGDIEDREPARDSWQWDLLRRKASPMSSGPLFIADTVASLAADANAYIRKRKPSAQDARRARRITAVEVLDPRTVEPFLGTDGRVWFRETSNGRTITLLPEDVLHIRTFNFGRRVGHDRSLKGINPIEALRRTMLAGLQRSAFEAAYYRNDARPGLVLKFPADLAPEEIDTYVEAWNDGHQGSARAGKAGGVGGGVDLEVIPPVNLVDAEFVAAQELSVRTIAGLYGMFSPLAGDSPEHMLEDAEQVGAFLYRYALGPLLNLIAAGINCDEDFFPPGEREQMSVQFTADALLEPDIETRVKTVVDLVHKGIITPNEGRVRLGIAKSDDPTADELLQTPAGAAPNNGGSGSGGSTSDDSDETPDGEPAAGDPTAQEAL